MGKLNADVLIKLIAEDYGIEAVKEYKFARDIVGDGKGIRERLKAHNLKDWRFDVAIPTKKIAIEFEGAVFTHGRHTRGLGYISDIHKYNAATVNGWKVIRYTHTHHSYCDVMAHLKVLIR